MNKVAFIFRTAPHGSAAGREGLDAVLATSALSEALAVFFMDDGVYQLKREQAPAAIHGRDYAPTFGLLELYDIEQVYVCAASLAERGLTLADLCIDAQACDTGELRRLLGEHDVRLSF
ncbi:intracellular sulfur oxidation protein DsrF [Oceanimonas sp. GK1]|uniref:sulfurtransferase complex subunit TusC n=1 Tax=Oceanimonas sp. (strain GK1 / IBRC-M 10197) TaxID=511062 RepID=UPI00024955F5|nr:sulfurtransferase complex subunit TusC [Oceanimonas sp. GK1]AEY02953.1 intracellular sulfur oxidation protein DsrF [Oceanimonas sp. GK1]